MRVLKIIVVVLFALFMAMAIAGMFMPSEWHVERSATMEARPEVVFEIVNTGKGWDAWTSWAAEHDPTWSMAIASDKAVGPGTIMKWSSEDYGAHSVTLQESEPPTRVTYDMYIVKQDMAMTGEVRIEPTSGGAKVTWSESGDVGSDPYARLMARLMKGLVEKDFDQGLSHMKDLAEAWEIQEKLRDAKQTELPEGQAADGELTEAPLGGPDALKAPDVGGER